MTPPTPPHIHARRSTTRRTIDDETSRHMHPTHAHARIHCTTPHAQGHTTTSDATLATATLIATHNNTYDTHTQLLRNPTRPHSSRTATARHVRPSTRSTMRIDMPPRVMASANCNPNSNPYKERNHKTTDESPTAQHGIPRDVDLRRAYLTSK